LRIEKKVKTRTLKTEGCGTPSIRSANCRSGIPVQCAAAQKKKISLRHPPADLAFGGEGTGSDSEFRHQTILQ